MSSVNPLEEQLRQLKLERDEADQRYNDALTALDRAAIPPLDLPPVAAWFDDAQAGALNEAWRVAPGPAPGGGVKGRLQALVRNAVAPYLERQERFNSWLVDHVNRNLDAARRAQAAQEQTADALRAHANALEAFRAHLIRYLQEITLYVDSRDREAASGSLVLNAALSGIADSADKRAETAAVRQQRLEARTAGLAGRVDDLHASLAIVEHASTAMKQAIEHMTGTGPVPPSGGEAATTADSAFTPSLDAYKYVAFEDQFRGSRDDIRTRLESYLPFFAGQSPVLDVGCGRGEFLELLAAAGVTASGIDLNAAMVEECRARGLDVTHADAVGHLSTLPDGSLGGLFAAQVVEHLQPAYLLTFLEVAGRKLRPGGRIVLETLNPACWVAFFESYIRDITHVWPLHPGTLQFLVRASGFASADIEYRSPVPAQDRLQSVQVPVDDPVLVDLADSLNANVARLNARLFTYLDYAIVGTR